MSRVKPIPRNVYTLPQILNELDLLDTPFLRFYLKGEPEVQIVQFSHLLNEDNFLALPGGWAETKWVYERTTEEWCPLFRFAGDVEKELLPLLSTVRSQHDDMLLYIPKGSEEDWAA